MLNFRTMAYLEFLTEQDKGRAVPLQGTRFVLGREEGCDLVISHVSISRRHALFTRTERTWWVEDMGSTNGIAVNGSAVPKSALADGDLLKIGSIKLGFREGHPGSSVVTVIERSRVERLMAGDEDAACGDEGIEEAPKSGSNEMESRREQRSLRLFVEIAAALDSFESIESLLDRCGDLIVGLFQPTCCVFEVMGERWTHGARGEESGKAKKSEFDISHTVLNRVADQGEALIVNDFLNMDLLLEAQSAQVLGIRSAMGAPVIQDDRAIGFIYLDQRQNGRSFTKEDLVSLIGISRLAAAAIAGSRKMVRLREENRMLRASETSAGTLMGKSPTIVELRRNIDERIGPVSSNILLLGETGTGKSLVAEAIHNASNRREGPFIKVNCAAIPKELMESELFGHEKGAFSGALRRKPGQFEMAEGGTIFLDEVGELDLASQAKLLAVTQDLRLIRVGGTEPFDVDVRILAATNRDLAHEVEQGRFRSDLYFRLAVVSLTVPPLRDRKEDIPLLCHHFLEKFCLQIGRRITRMSDEVMNALCRYDWPGNIRELSNCVERAVIFGDDGRPLDLHHLPGQIIVGAGPGGKKEVERESRPGLVEEKERDCILDALERCGGNKRKAARLLGWYPQKLYHRLRKYGLEQKER